MQDVQSTEQHVRTVMAILLLPAHNRIDPSQPFEKLGVPMRRQISASAMRYLFPARLHGRRCCNGVVTACMRLASDGGVLTSIGALSLKSIHLGSSDRPTLSTKSTQSVSGTMSRVSGKKEALQARKSSASCRTNQDALVRCQGVSRVLSESSSAVRWSGQYRIFDRRAGNLRHRGHRGHRRSTGRLRR